MESREGIVRSVVWRDVFPGVLLFRTLRASFRFRVLILAFAGYLLTVLGGWLIGLVVFGGTEDTVVERSHQELLEAFDGDAARRSLFAASDAESDDGMAAVVNAAAAAPAAAWSGLAAPLVRLFHPQLSPTAVGYLISRNLWNVLVWAFFGGAIVRIAAFELTRRESLGLERAALQTAVRYPAHVLAPLIAAAAIFLAALPLVVVGVFARLEAVAWVAGMLWFAILLVGLLLAVLAIGLVVGWPLMWAAIAVEQSDAFDAVSRAYAYVFQRPLHLAGYAVIAAALGFLGAVAANLFAATTIALADSAVGWGSGAETFAALQGQSTEALQEDTWLAGAAAGRGLWTRMVLAVAAAYPIGFLWAAAVGIYLLLRWHVDGAETDEIADDELEAAAGLPPLKPHESGIPEVETRPATGPQSTPSPE